ncbi:MAG: VOC family protein [Pseudomonadota bacterium]
MLTLLEHRSDPVLDGARARALAGAGDWAGARTLARALTAAHPQDPQRWQLRAQAAAALRDYDEAIAYYCDVLGFELVADEDQGRKRWVVVSPGSGGANLLLARATTDDQTSRVGNQTGGRVGFFLNTTHFLRDHALYVERGVQFLEAPRLEAYGMVAKFVDCYGNVWDLLEPA